MTTSREGSLPPPTEDQKRHARAVMEPLTDTQRRAVCAVVAYETVQELADGWRLHLCDGSGENA